MTDVRTATMVSWTCVFVVGWAYAMAVLYDRRCSLRELLILLTLFCVQIGLFAHDALNAASFEALETRAPGVKRSLHSERFLLAKKDVAEKIPFADGNRGSGHAGYPPQYSQCAQKLCLVGWTGGWSEIGVGDASHNARLGCFARTDTRQFLNGPSAPW